MIRHDAINEYIKEPSSNLQLTLSSIDDIKLDMGDLTTDELEF